MEAHREPVATLDEPRSGPPRSGRRRTAVVSATVVVVIVAITASLVARNSKDARRDAHRRSTGSVSTLLPAVRPGMKLTALHGLTLQIPVSWSLNAANCGTAERHTTITWTGPVASCAAPRPHGVSSTEFDEWGTLDARDGVTGAAAATWQPAHDTSVSQLPATTRSGTAGELFLEQIAVPSRSVGVIIATPSQTETSNIAASAVVTDADPSGCRAHTSVSTELRTDLKPVRDGADTSLFPDGVRSIRVCNYGFGFLRTGVTLSAAQVATLVPALNRTPAGASETNPRNYLPSLCPDPRHANKPFSSHSEDNEWSVLTAGYASGPSVTVTVRLGLCGRLGAANGSYSVQRTDAMIQALRDVTVFGSWPDGMVALR